METVINITQTKINESLSSMESASKIKLRTLSHANLIKHVKNVPYKVMSDLNIKHSNSTSSFEEKKVKVSPKKFIELIENEYKPINVKEDKINNIRKNSNSLINETIKNEDKYKESVLSETADKIDSHQGIPMVEDAYQQEQTTENSIISKTENIVDINEYINKLNDETQLVKNVKEEAKLAQQEAISSDENLNKLSVEVSELEKQKAAVEKQDSELNQQVILAYEEQKKTLSIARKKYQELIQEANDRKKSNESKIVEFESKIGDIRNSISSINDNIARKQNILNALQQAELIDTFTNNDNNNSLNEATDDMPKKIA